MNVQDKIFKQEINIKDVTFDIDLMNYYELYICLGEDGLRFMVVNSQDSRCLLLEQYQFFSRLNTDEIITALNHIYDVSLFLKANFWYSINIILRGQAFTLIPRDLYDASEPEKYLKNISEANTSLSAIANLQKSFPAFNVFWAEDKLLDWFKQSYPNRQLNYMHQSQAFVEGIFKQNQGKKGFDQIHIFIEPTYFIASVWQDNRLIMSNIFHYRTAPDFIYFVLFIMDELRLDKESCPVKLYGKINPVSEIIKLSRTYLNQVSIYAGKPTWLKFNSDFDNLTDTYYFDLYSMPLCRS